MLQLSRLFYRSWASLDNGDVLNGKLLEAYIGSENAFYYSFYKRLIDNDAHATLGEAAAAHKRLLVEP